MSDDAIVTFIRIPKNASTSLYSFFGTANTVRNEYLSADNPKHLGIFESSHQSISELQHNLGSHVLEKPILAVVRNPFDRLVSMYFFAQKHDLGKIYDIDTGSFLSFARGFYRLSKDKNFFHAMPQVKFIEHDQSYWFTVVKFENLKEGIRGFIEENGFNDCFDAEKLETLNTTDHLHYSYYYDDETKQIVKDMWGCDLDAFSYSFDDSGHR